MYRDNSSKPQTSNSVIVLLPLSAPLHPIRWWGFNDYLVLTPGTHNHHASRYSTHARLAIDSSAKTAAEPHLYGNGHRGYINFLSLSTFFIFPFCTTNHCHHHHYSTDGRLGTYIQCIIPRVSHIVGGTTRV